MIGHRPKTACSRARSGIPDLPCRLDGRRNAACTGARPARTGRDAPRPPAPCARPPPPARSRVPGSHAEPRPPGCDIRPTSPAPAATPGRARPAPAPRRRPARTQGSYARLVRRAAHYIPRRTPDRRFRGPTRSARGAAFRRGRAVFRPPGARLPSGARGLPAGRARHSAAGRASRVRQPPGAPFASLRTPPPGGRTGPAPYTAGRLPGRRHYSGGGTARGHRRRTGTKSPTTTRERMTCGR